MSDYCDLQVNGAFGIDFNGDSLSVEELEFVCQSLAKSGVSCFLPTVITDSIPRMCEKLQRLVRCRAHSPISQAMIPGYHVEGPFLSDVTGYVGAHPKSETCQATIEHASKLWDACEGRLALLTLAPERDPGGTVTRWFADRHVCVSAGHTDATLDELKACLDQGLSAFTHLGNATPPLMPRHDNIIQRALFLRDRICIMLIADGHHLPPFMLDNLLCLLGCDKTVVVTDCISAAGLGPGRFQLGEQSVWVTDDLACRSSDGSHFVGSAATMPMMAKVLTGLDWSEREQLQLLNRNPRKLIQHWLA